MRTLQRSKRFEHWIDVFERIDRTIADTMSRIGIPLSRIAIGIVFVWFGALKIIGISPAADIVEQTIFFFPPSIFIPILGIWEVLIGIGLLYRPLVRFGILLLAFQMPGTFLPVVLRPDLVFTVFPYGLTVEGQYIVKNLVIIAAALVVGGTVRKNS